MTRVVIDTNVFVSGTLWKGIPQRVLQAWAENRFKLVVSSEVVQEYEAVLNKLLDHQPELVNRLVETVRLHAEYVQPAILPNQICRDPDDDVFIATALSGKADYLVSGDKDLS
jgi:putative PIN family toxin of toxin-antitoxin system